MFDYIVFNTLHSNYINLTNICKNFTGSFTYNNYTIYTNTPIQLIPIFQHTFVFEFLSIFIFINISGRNEIKLYSGTKNLTPILPTIFLKKYGHKLRDIL